MRKMYVLLSDIHCVKYVKIRASYDPYVPVYDSVLTRDNADTILFIYGKIQIGESPHFSIFTTTVSNQTDFTILKFCFF